MNENIYLFFLKKVAPEIGGITRMMKPECDFLNQDPKRPKAQTKTLPNRAAKNGGQDRWCFCASATASAAPRASPPSSPWRRPSNLVKPCRAPVLRVCPSSETPAPFLLHLLPFPRPPASSRTHFFSLLSPAPLSGSAPKRFRAMATDVAAAAVDPPAARGCPAMKAEFAKHAEYLNALVRRPLMCCSSAFFPA